MATGLCRDPLTLKWDQTSSDDILKNMKFLLGSRRDPKMPDRIYKLLSDSTKESNETIEQWLDPENQTKIPLEQLRKVAQHIGVDVNLFFEDRRNNWINSPTVPENMKKTITALSHRSYWNHNWRFAKFVDDVVYYHPSASYERVSSIGDVFFRNVLGLTGSKQIDDLHKQIYLKWEELHNEEVGNWHC